MMRRATIGRANLRIATSGDGNVLLLRSTARLQTETDFGAQGKIFAWVYGEWMRAATAPNGDGYLFRPDVTLPFISQDARIPARLLDAVLSGSGILGGFARGTQIAGKLRRELRHGGVDGEHSPSLLASSLVACWTAARPFADHTRLYIRWMWLTLKRVCSRTGAS